MTSSLMPVSSVPFVTPVLFPHDSVDKVAHLVQFEQKVVRDVERGEAYAHCNGPFNPVHAQAFVQSAYDSLMSYDRTHGSQNGAVG